jgi:hypothetical protein
MYHIVFDSDGLLKTYKAGLLNVGTLEHLCSLPEEIFQDTVVAAQQTHAEEAKAFQELISGGRLRRRSLARSARAERLLGLSQTLGPGERGALRLLFREKADVIVTDDRAFLNGLVRNRVPFLTPASLLIDLRRAGKIAREAAQAAAERLRPYIRQEVYESLLARLGEIR